MDMNRRTFLLGTAAAAATATAAQSATKANTLQQALDAMRVKTGLSIKRIESFTQGDLLSVVRLTADDGSQGMGQISTYDADISATVLHRKIAPFVLGQDPGDFETISVRCIEENYKYPWSYVNRALTGVDTAIWDLLGKRADKSVCELLGGTPGPIPVYGSSMSREITPKDEAERLLRLRDELGYRAFKVRVGKTVGHDQDQWPGRTEEIIPTVRKALGDDVALLVDGNSCYTPAKAIEVGRMLEDHGYSHFEEPCPYWELEWTAEVTRALSVPVAGGEQDNDLAQWRRMIGMKAVDIVQPDICYLGGLTRSLKVAEMAAEAGVTCVPHSANLAMVTVYTLHMMGVIPNAGDHVEFSIEPTPWIDGLYSPALTVNDGKVTIPDGPGWGVTFNPEWITKAERQVSER